LAGTPRIVALLLAQETNVAAKTYRLTTSSGPRRDSSLPPGPEEKMIPFPPVTRTNSRALLRKFWRYRFAASGGVERGGNRPAE
jgi:hypothetical protein